MSGPYDGVPRLGLIGGRWFVLSIWRADVCRSQRVVDAPLGTCSRLSLCAARGHRLENLGIHLGSDEYGKRREE